MSFNPHLFAPMRTVAGACAVCDSPEPFTAEHVAHKLRETAADAAMDNDMDTVSGLPYHSFTSNFTGVTQAGEAPCGICGFGPAAHVHNQPPRVPPAAEGTSDMLADSQWAEAAKHHPKKGKHHFVHPLSLSRGVGYYGPGLCAACGNAASDPDHDGDVDNPSAGDPAPASGGGQMASLQGIYTNTPGVWTEQAAGSGTMVALFPKKQDANKIALGKDVKDREDPKDLHVTMAHLPNFDPKNLQALHNAVGHFAARTAPIKAVVSGKGEFHPTAGSDDKPVTYASVDAPGIADHHIELKHSIQDRGIPVSQNHGFTPHMTLKYGKHAGDTPHHPLTFDHITVAHGDQRTHFPLSGTSAMPGSDAVDMPMGIAHTASLQVTDRPTEAQRLMELDSAPVDMPREGERAFFTEVNNKMLLTAPAWVPPVEFERALSPNNFMMHMAGRFVGGEKANRNRAFWSLGDLEFGAPTVAHGPLNWLHEGRHIIGSITDQKLIIPTSEQAAEGFEPHIAAMSGIWRWIYPDEAEVIEQASDQGKLWYSMECVSNEVECVGEGGCGAKVGYLDYIKNAPGSCQHMKQRAGADRRFAEPTFLGGAVIVPPVRPGWADANASVMRQAASLAEKAFEQAGKPDMPAGDWERLMADVLTYAGV